jgi:drug/metabolite transporter (DMT)-like permease
MKRTGTEDTHKDEVVLGMLAALGAFLMFTLMNVFAKLLAVRHSVIEIAFYRNVIAFIPFLFLALVLGRREMLVIRSRPKLVIGRALFGTVSLTLTFYAYSLMPMADTTAFLFASSLFVPVLGIVFLGERVGIYRWSAVLVGFAGVLIMIRPTGQVNGLGVTVAMLAASMHAVLQIILRHIGKFERPETVTFYFFLVGIVITAIPLPFVAVRPAPAEIPLLLGVGITGAAAQFLLSTAFRNAPATIVTVFNYSGIVWATLFGWLIWNEWPLPMVFVGGTIVIAANLLIIWRESRLGRITGDRVRAKL